MPSAPSSRMRAASAAVLALTVGLTACSGGSTAATGGGEVDADGVAAATAAVQAATGDPAFELDAPAFAMSGIRGKTVFNIPNSSAVPYVQAVDEESAAIAERYGATWVEYTNQGTPTEHSAGIDQAISRRADVIVLAQGINVDLIVPALQRAKAAGIPVVVTHTLQTGDTFSPQAADLVTAQVTAPFDEAAALIANWAIADSGGEANAVLLTADEVPPSKGMIASMRATFEQNCPACSVKVVNVPVTDWATKISGEVQTALQADPGVGYVLPVYDSMSLYAQQGITAAGKTGQVQMASFNGTPEVLKLIQDGDVMAMDVGENISWLAWSTLDQVGRVLTGSPLVEGGDEKTPLKVFTDDNVDATGTPPAAGKGYGDAYVAGYEALWGAP
ncbi:sugar ABC transporter substrate-binding protein [Kineococcus aurantiacus]|uniref:Ribose transport system substrate-binding protein n=1 Tax=Kineococcus aurantiacus TaxID=37633 RepID=A0A7Y9DQ35_9ACTN|nr:ribose transport system substrate-binding protein [Kineococcus aurantiacus]